MLPTKRAKQLKPILFFLLFIPSFYWGYMFIQGNLGINPIEKLMDKFGEMALRLIILILLVSSLFQFHQVVVILIIQIQLLFS